MSNRRLIGLMRKEFIQFFRDKTLVILILYTFVEIALCGWALTLDVENMPTAVYDADRSAQSRSLVAAFDRLDSFELITQVSEPDELNRLMDTGRAKFALVIPAEFGRNLAGGESVQVQLLVDGSNGTLAGQAIADARGLIRQYGDNIAVERLVRSGQSGHRFLPQVQNLVRIWYMPQLKYVHFIMLTMLAIAVLILGVIIPAAGIVREKEAGTFEQLMLTPLSGVELIVAKILPMLLVKLVGLTIGVAISLFMFDVPLRGSLLLFYGASVLMFLSSSGIGVLMGVYVQNMKQTLLLAFFILFPVAFLSGTMVPIENMPPFLQFLTYFSPLRYYVDTTLGIFLKGIGISVLWPELLALAAYGLLLLGFSASRFQKILT